MGSWKLCIMNPNLINPDLVVGLEVWISSK